MKQELKKISNVNLGNKTFSRRAFLGTLASLATTSFAGCSTLGQKKQSSSFSSTQNLQANNQQEVKIEEELTKESIDYSNNGFKATEQHKKEQSENYKKEVEKQQENLQSLQQEQLKTENIPQETNTTEQQPKINTQPKAQTTVNSGLPSKENNKQSLPKSFIRIEDVCDKKKWHL